MQRYLYLSISLVTIFLLGCKNEVTKIEDLNLLTKAEIATKEGELSKPSPHTHTGQSLQSSYFPNSDTFPLTEVVTYERLESTFRPLTVKYFFADDSDTSRFILYEWSQEKPIMTPDERAEILKDEAEHFEEYRAFYYQLAQVLINKYGDPIEGRGKIKNIGTKVDPIWKGHLRFSHDNLYIDHDFIWIPSRTVQVYKVVVRVFDNLKSSTK